MEKVAEVGVSETITGTGRGKQWVKLKEGKYPVVHLLIQPCDEACLVSTPTKKEEPPTEANSAQG